MKSELSNIDGTIAYYDVEFIYGKFRCEIFFIWKWKHSPEIFPDGEIKFEASSIMKLLNDVKEFMNEEHDEWEIIK